VILRRGAAWGCVKGSVQSLHSQPEAGAAGGAKRASELDMAALAEPPRTFFTCAMVLLVRVKSIAPCCWLPIGRPAWRGLLLD
jgi:hypothetical protein